MNTYPPTCSATNVAVSVSQVTYVPCAESGCNFRMGEWELTDDDAVFRVRLWHGSTWHYAGIRLSTMLRKAAGRPEMLRKVLQKVGVLV